MKNFKLAGGEIETDPTLIGITNEEIHIFDQTELLGAWGQIHLENPIWDEIESSEEINPNNHIVRFKTGREKLINIAELRFTILCEKIAKGESGPQLANAVMEEYKKYNQI